MVIRREHSGLEAKMERQDGEPRCSNPQDTGDTPGVQKGDGLHTLGWFVNMRPQFRSTQV